MSYGPDAYSWREAYDRRGAPPVALDPNDPLGQDVTLHNESVRPTGFAEWFAVSQTVLPALVLLPGSQAYRLPVRVGAYAISLFAFALWWFDKAGRKQGKQPAELWLILSMGVTILMLFHPYTVSMTAGVGQVMLYFAILCPLFWARAYVTDRRMLVRVLALLLVCNGINSIVGVLQVYNPAVWMPRELSEVYRNQNALSMVSYMGPNGRLIIRPPGLFDTPGAVCSAGTIAALFGLVFCVEPIASLKRAIALAMAGAGLAAIYLSNVRTSLVVAVAMMALYAAMMAVQKQTQRMVGFATLGVGLVLGSFSLALVLGGATIGTRFSTLLEGDPRTLYFENRGVSIEYGFNTLLVDYPLGAGLARWGMMKAYFGTDDPPDGKDVFAEVQPSAWILDGGVFLLVTYSLSLMVTVFYDVKLLRSLADRTDRVWAAVVIAANFGTLALVFSFVPFGTAVGMQFWFLEGALHGAMAKRPRLA